MDARLTDEQRALRETVSRMVAISAVSEVAGLGDEQRAQRLARDIVNGGLRDLRDADAGPTGVEVAIVAEQLSNGVAEASFLGPILAADLCRRAGVRPQKSTTVALTGDLSRIATGDDLPSAAVFDANGETHALFVTDAAGKFGLGRTAIRTDGSPVDLSRVVGRPSGGATEDIPGAVLSAEDLAAWRSFGHAVLSADLLGAARAAHRATVEYACVRMQYGRAISSFQAVQHLLAESLILLEGAESAVNYAAWAADAEPTESAIDTALAAKLYVAGAARTICETAIQVHGGIGNTWECMVHVHLRRVLLAAQVLGDEGALMDELVDRRLRAA